jgi:hypothetical protein
MSRGQAGLPAGGTRRGPRQQVIEQVGVRGIVYAGTSGCRVIVLFHKLALTTTAAPAFPYLRQPSPECYASATPRQATMGAAPLKGLLNWGFA